MAWKDDYVSPLRVVSGYDPALDDEKMDRRAYTKSRNPEAVRELPGRKARWWILRPLSVDDRLACDQAGTSEAKFVRAVIFGVAGVELCDEGRHLSPTKTIEGRDGAIWGDADLKTLIQLFGMDVIYEIGIVIYARSGWGNGWACGAGSYPAPQALSQELAQTARQRADVTPSTATES